MDAVTHLAPTVGVLAACDALRVARASFYRQRPMLGPLVSPGAQVCLASGAAGVISIPQSRPLRSATGQ